MFHWPHKGTDLPVGTYSVELERARNFFPFSFLRLPLRFPREKQNINHFKYEYINYMLNIYWGWHLMQERTCMSRAAMCPPKQKHMYWLLWLHAYLLVVDKITTMIKTWGYFFSSFYHRCAPFFLFRTNTLQPLFLMHPSEIQSRICVLPCHELLLGRPFSQMSEMCLASGILSLHEWDRPLDLHTHTYIWHGQNIISTSSFKAVTLLLLH